MEVRERWMQRAALRWGLQLALFLAAAEIAVAGVAARATTPEPRSPAATPRAAVSDEPPPSPHGPPHPASHTGTGSGNGESRWRRALRERGIGLEGGIAAELWGAVRGGVRSGRLRHLVAAELELELDAEAAGLWRGGRVVLVGEALFWRPDLLDRDVSGDPVEEALNPVSDLDAPSSVQLGQAYYEHRFLDDRLVVRLGRQYAEEDFVTPENATWFLNGGVAPPDNVPLPSYPESSLGLTLRADVTAQLTLRGGVYGANPELRDYGDGGLFSGELLALGEAEWRGAIAGQPGSTRLGLSGVFDEVAALDASRRDFDRNYGIWFSHGQQLLGPVPGGAAGRRLDAHLIASWAPGNRNEIEGWYGVGLVATGLLPGRPRDRLGVGAYYADLSSRAERGPREVGFELFYRLPLGLGLALQPDLQWILRPGGEQRNAIVLGLRGDLSF